MSIRIRWAMLLPIPFMACAVGDTHDRVTVRDSAGVRIVENRLEPGDIDWALAETPDVAIGVLEGAAEEQLYCVSGARWLGDRIVVANAGTDELRFFDESGRFLSAAGGEGEGPGEFRGLGGVYRYDRDSLLAYDYALRRVSVFGTDGAFARSVQLPSIGDVQYPQLAGVFGDGTLFVRGTVERPGGRQDGLSRDPVRLYRLAVDGAVQDTLVELAGDETFMQAIGDLFMVTSLGFGRSLSVAAQGDRFYSGESDAYEIAARSKDGTLERLIRLARDDRPVTPDDVAAFKRSRLEDIEDDNAHRRIESLLEAMVFPATMPAYSDLRLDSENHVWVQDYRAPGEETNRWTVFDVQGRALGRIDLPHRFTVYEIGSDYILGRRVDELDVEHVELYRLDRSFEP